MSLKNEIYQLLSQSCSACKHRHDADAIAFEAGLMALDVREFRATRRVLRVEGMNSLAWTNAKLEARKKRIAAQVAKLATLADDFGTIDTSQYGCYPFRDKSGHVIPISA